MLFPGSITPHYGGPGEVHEADTRRGSRHGNTRCGTSEGVRRRAARTGRHVPHRHGSPHSQDARHAQRQPDRHPARPRKNRDKRIPLFGALLHGDGHAAQGYDARLRQRGVRGARGVHQGRGAEHHQRFAQHTEGSIVRHQEHRQQTRHHQLHLFQPRLRGCRPPAAARSAGTAGACPPPAGDTRTRTAARGAEEQDTEQGQTGHRPAAERILPPAADTHHPGGVGRQRGRSRNRPHARGGQDEEVEQRGGRNVQQGAQQAREAESRRGGNTRYR